jgi:hypothetical protein
VTFSAPKSVSVVWALGDPWQREQIEAAHAQPPTAGRVAAFHQRHELRTVDRRQAVDPEARERLGIRQPTPRRLRQLAVGREVVVAPKRGDRLALQVLGVAGAPSGSGHHNALRPREAENGHCNRTAIAGACIWCGFQ